jgi:hypothetical protein
LSELKNNILSYLHFDIFYSYSLSIDITEEGSDVGDDSDDGDFEPSLKRTGHFSLWIDENVTMTQKPT